MGKDILLIGNTGSSSARLLLAEAQQHAYSLDVLPVNSLSYTDGVLEQTTTTDRNFFAYDVYYFRGLGRQPEKLAEMQALAAHLQKQGKRVVEACLGTTGLPEDSFVPVSTSGTYQVPETYTYAVTDELDDRIEYPVVIKKFQSSLGKGIKKVYEESEIHDFVAAETNFIVQKFYDIAYDTRVLVVGDTVVGGFDRFRPEGEPLLTTRKGGKRTVAELTEAQRSAALEATKLKRLEIAGVDMFMFQNELYVLEVNASPQFHVLSRKTGISAAALILDYIVR